MARIQILKILVNERLTAAAEEIFDAFERTIIQYEDEIDRQRKLLDFGPKRRTDPLQLRVCEEMVPHVQQERSPSVGQEDPEPLKIKEEQEELWTSREGEHLQGLKETDIIKFTFTPVPGKSENDGESLRLSQLSQTHMDADREEDPLPSTSTQHLKTEPDGEDGGLSEHATNWDPAIDFELTSDGQLLSSNCYGIDDVDEWRLNRECQSDLNTLTSWKTQRVKGQSSSTSNKFKTSMESSHELRSANLFSFAQRCKVCGKSCSNKISLMNHVKINSNDYCLCGKHLEPTESLTPHLQDHRTCDVCGKTFTKMKNLVRHMKTHTDEKRFGCALCDKRFNKKGNLNMHMKTHTGEKPFSCSVCGKGFRQNGDLKVHMRTHTGEKPYCCKDCGKRFGHSVTLGKHMRVHTGEKPFSCAVCGKGFREKGHLQTHMRIHTGERPYSCSACGKAFIQMVNLKSHKCRTESSGM